MSWTWRGTGFLCHREDPRAKEAKEALDRNKYKVIGKANRKARGFMNASIEDTRKLIDAVAVENLQDLYRKALLGYPYLSKDGQFAWILTEIRKIIKNEISGKVEMWWLKDDVDDKIKEYCTKDWLKGIMRRMSWGDFST
jgi:hypothetical protein